MARRILGTPGHAKWEQPHRRIAAVRWAGRPLTSADFSPPALFVGLSATPATTDPSNSSASPSGARSAPLTGASLAVVVGVARGMAYPTVVTSPAGLDTTVPHPSSGASVPAPLAGAPVVLTNVGPNGTGGGGSPNAALWIQTKNDTNDNITLFNPSGPCQYSQNIYFTVQNTGPVDDYFALSVIRNGTGNVTLAADTLFLPAGASQQVAASPSADSSKPFDTTIVVSEYGLPMASDSMTIVNVQIPMKIRATDTPKVEYDRIPPRVTTPLPAEAPYTATVTPDLTGSGQTVTLGVVQVGPEAGTATVNGANSLDLTTTTNFRLQGVTQTSSPGTNYLGVKVRGAGTVGSQDFCIAAISQNFTISLIGPATEPGQTGIIVQDGWESDSGNIGDLDQVFLSEVVQVGTGTGSLQGYTTTASGYSTDPATIFDKDQHTTPNGMIVSPGGQVVVTQATMFKDDRTGAQDIPMTKSGYSITRTVAFEPVSGLWRLTTDKVGAAVTANGKSSAAGAGTADMTQ